MSFKGFILSLCLLLLFGVGLLFLSFPNDRERALIYFKDRRYQEAFDTYAELYEDGEKRLNVVLPLVELNLLFGNTGEAAELMEEVLEEHPNLPEGRKWLGDLYRYDSRPGDYLANLEVMSEKQPTEESLKELIDIYKQYGMQQDLLLAYEKLYKLGNRQEPYLYGMAFLYANRRDYPAAIRTLESLKIEQIESSDTALFLVNLYLDIGQDDEAFDVASQFLAKSGQVNDALQLSNVFFEYGYAEDAYALISPYQKHMTQHPELFSAFVTYGQSLGKKEELFVFMRQIFDQGALPHIVIDNFITLAVQEGDQEVITKLLKEANFHQFSEQVLIDLLNYASLTENQEMLSFLHQNIPEARVRQSKVLRVALHLSQQDNPEDAKAYIKNVVRSENLSVPETLEVVTLLQNTGNVELTKDVFDSIQNLDGMSPEMVERYTTAGIYLGMQERVAKLLASHPRKGNPKDQEVIGNSQIFLQIAQGDIEGVQLALSQDAFSFTQLEQMTDIALFTKQDTMSLVLSEFFLETRPSLKADIAYIEALLLNREYAKATPLINTLLETQPSLVELLDLKMQAMAMTSQGTRESRLAFERALEEYMANEAVPLENKVNLGFVLINREHKELAKLIFFSLAQDPHASDSVLQTLIGLYSKDPSDQELALLYQMAPQMSGQVKVDAIYYLSFVAKRPELVPHIVRTDELDTFDIGVAFLQSMQQTRDKDRFVSVLHNLSCLYTSVEKLYTLGDLAFDYGAFRESTFLFERVLKLDPAHEKALQKLIYATYFIGDYPRAMSLLEFYLGSCPQDYLAYFAYAQILYENRLVVESYAFYLETLRQIRALNLYDQVEKVEDLFEQQEVRRGLEVAANTTRTASLYRLERRHQALEYLTEYVRQDPENLTLVYELLIHLERAKYYQVAHSFAEKMFGHLAEDLSRFPKPEWNTVFSIYLERARICRLLYQTQKAECLLQEVAEYLGYYEYPANYFQARAELQLQYGQWRACLDTLGIANTYSPDSCAYGLFAKDVWQEYRPYISGGYTTRVTDDNQTEHLWKAENVLRFQEKWKLMSFFEANDFSSKEVLRASDGATLPWRGLRYRSSVAVGFDFYGGDEAFAGVFVGNEHVGFQGGYTFVDTYGDTSVRLYYHYPTWAVIEAVAQMGVMDEIQVGKRMAWNQCMRFEGTAGFRFWGIDHRPEVAKSFKFDASLTYSMSHALIQSYLGESGFIDFAYVLDAEYVLDRKKVVDPFAERVPVLNLLTQETHSLIAIVEYDFSKNILSNSLWELQAFGGYSFNRLGRGGAAYGLLFNYQKPYGWQFTASASRRASTTTPGDQKELSVNLKVPF